MFATRLLKNLFEGRTRAASRKPQPRTRLTVEPLEAREVLSLSPISANAGFPYTAIVELSATFPDHRTFVGSGVMVDRFHVLTAGHVLYSSADGGFASSIRATPELSGGSAPFGAAYMSRERTYNAFVNYDKTHPGTTRSGDYDIGLITLDRTIGDRSGWMSYGYDNKNADFAAGAILNTAGYPAAGGYDGKHMEFSSGAIAGLSPDGLAIDYRQPSITTYGGQSGSPVWRYTPSDGKRVVYGIHVAGSGTSSSMNFATRITQSIFNDLQNWRTADQAPRSQSAGALVGGDVKGLTLGTPNSPPVSGKTPAVAAKTALPQTTPLGHDAVDRLWSSGAVAALLPRHRAATAAGDLTYGLQDSPF